MRKLIIIRSNASGLGTLLKNGSEIELESLSSEPDFSGKKKQVVLITPEGSTDKKEKTVAEVLSDPSLVESEKPAKKARYLKQLFRRAMAQGADIVIIDNGKELVVDENDCRSEARTFEYDAVQFVTVEQDVPIQSDEEPVKEQKRKKWF